MDKLITFRTFNYKYHIAHAQELRGWEATREGVCCLSCTKGQDRQCCYLVVSDHKYTKSALECLRIKMAVRINCVYFNDGGVSGSFRTHLSLSQHGLHETIVVRVLERNRWKDGDTVSPPSTSNT